MNTENSSEIYPVLALFYPFSYSGLNNLPVAYIDPN